MQYDKKFFASQSTGSARAARKIIPIVVDLLRPSSVLDIGCGTGGWLKAAREAGVSDTVGIDGQWAINGGLVIDREQFVAHDVASRIDLQRKFDLAMTLEVAEHIPVSKSDVFVDNLCKHADVILFSAALPGQGGRMHINEQPLAFWIEKFAERNFKFIDVLRPFFWQDSDIGPCYRQNLVLFVSNKRAAEVEIDAQRRLGSTKLPVNVAHPELLKERAEYGAFPPIVRARFAIKLLLSLVSKSYRSSL